MKLAKNCVRGLLAIAAAGTMFEGSCSSAEVKAILDGVQVAADGLDQANNDNVSFTDWLDSQLD